jgi:hypothetical protein
MHELGRPGRRPARQIVHFAKKNGVSPARRIARDAAAIDAASNDGEIENPIQLNVSPNPIALHFGDFTFVFELTTNQNESKRKMGTGEGK